MNPRAWPAAVRARMAECLMTLPSLGWLVVFFVVPTLMIFTVAFRPTVPTGGIGEGWTLQTVRDLWTADQYRAYPAIFWRTIWMSVVATAICLVLSVPIAYHLARVKPGLRAWLLLLIVVPFWTNFLIRIYAWRTVLHTNAPLASLFKRLGWMTENELFNGPGTVLLVMVYSYLPFAILPLFAAAEKFDFTLLDAARDLGATSWQAFRKVFIPAIRRGLENATLMVLIPCLGAYIIPKLMGSRDMVMIGNKIAQNAVGTRNLPHASALAALLMGLVLALLAFFLWLRRDRRKTRTRRRNAA